MAYNTDKWYERCQEDFKRWEQVKDDWERNGNPYKRNTDRQYYEDMYGKNKNSTDRYFKVPSCAGGDNSWYWNNINKNNNYRNNDYKKINIEEAKRKLKEDPWFEEAKRKLKEDPFFK